MTIRELFNRLLASEPKTESYQRTLDELRTLYDQSLGLSKEDVGYWSSITIDNYHFLFSQTIFFLVNRHLAEINQEFATNYSGRTKALFDFFRKISKIPNFSLNYDLDRKDELESPSYEIGNLMKDIRGMISNLLYFRRYGDESEFNDSKLRLTETVGYLRNLASSANQLDEFISAVKSLFSEVRMEHGNFLNYSGEKSDATILSENNKAKQLLRERDLIKYLVSTDEYSVYFHRTSSAAALNIDETGFATSYAIANTASSSYKDENDAMDEFLRRHSENDAVVVMRIPKDASSRIDDAENPPVPIELYADNKSRGPVIPPSWIVGYIDRDKLEMTMNPHFGDTHYDSVKPRVTYSPF